MGEIKCAYCLNCTYKSKDLYVGGGFLNHTRVDDQPVYNIDTQEVETANAKERQQVMKDNPDIVFYDTESLRKKNEGPDIPDWHENALIDEKETMLILNHRGPDP